MKTKLLIVAVLCFYMTGGSAQTNLNFESWGPSTYATNDPTGWATFNLDNLGLPVSTFKQTAQPGEGLASARLVTTAGYASVLPNDIAGGFLALNGDLATNPVGGIPYTQKPTSVDLVYKSNVAAGDTGIFLASLSHWDGSQTVVDGQAYLLFTAPAVNSWTPANLPFQYYTLDTPDTLQIIAMSSAELLFGSPVAVVGSEIQLDALVINTGVQPCNNPVAFFSSTTSLLTAMFTNSSTTTGNVTYSWNFGDGVGTSSQPNPVYTYSAGGTYNVCLTVTDSCGTNQSCQSVTVTGGCPAPTSSFSATSTSGLSVTFLNSSSTTGNVTYFWDFGDFFGTSVLQNPSYTYSASGTYNVCLTVTDDCGTNQSCQNVTVTSGGCPTPTAGFTSSANGLTATFVNTSSGTGTITYAWNFGDGNMSTTSNPSHIYALAGTYNVCLTITDSCGANTDCQMVTVTSGGGCTLTVTATATDETTAGANDGTATAFVSNGTAPYVYLWSDPANQATAIATGLAPGTYTVTVVDADTCMATATVTVLPGSVACQIQVQVTASSETTVGGNDGAAMAVATSGTQPYTYIWSTGATTSSISGLAPAVYSCTVTDADGCSISGTAVVQAFTCTLTGSISKTDETAVGAMDGTATVAASGGTPPYSYLWNTMPTQTTAGISNLGPGFYSVTVTDAKGCTYSASAAINPGGVNCTLTATVTGTAESQAGATDGTASVAVTGGTALVTVWYPGGQATDTITGLAPGDYTVTVTDSLGCNASGTYTVAPGLIIGVSGQPVPMIFVKVYPNPAVDMINFEIKGIDRGVLYVFDFAGRQVKEAVISGALTEISTDDLGNGMYFYRFVGTGSHELGSGKFVIQK